MLRIRQTLVLDNRRKRLRAGQERVQVSLSFLRAVADTLVPFWLCDHARPARHPGDRRPRSLTCNLTRLVTGGAPMPRRRGSLMFAVTLTFTAASMAAHAQYYNQPPSGYGYSPPPCQAVTPGPFQGAARGAAGGALIGAISGNAGRGAAIGAGFGAVRSAVRRGSARSAGACY